MNVPNSPLPPGAAAMSKELQQLIEMAQRAPMTPEQQEEQRISFAYGNAKLSDDSITREDVIAAARRVKESRNDDPPTSAGQPSP